MSWIGKAASYALLTALSIVALLPTLWVVVSSFGTSQDVFTGQLVPTQFSLQGYIDLFQESDLLGGLINTALYATFGTIGCIVVGFMAAYPTARLNFPLRNSVVVAFSAALAVPIIGLIVPEFFIMQELRLYDSRIGLSVFYVALFFPLSFVILRTYLLRIPVEVEEAALVDGASFFQIMFRIALPLARPAIATVAVVIFIGIWNEFLFALVLNPSSENMNAQVALSQLRGRFNFNVTAMLAGASLVMIVPIALFMLLSRHVIAGLTAGSNR